MIPVPRSDFEALKKANLIKCRTKYDDPNFVVLNKKHKSRNKTYLVSETGPIMAFLNTINGR